MLLIIDKKRSDANTVSDIFKYMGIVSYGTTPENAALEFSNRHKAILFIRPELNKATEDLIKSFKTYSLDTSVFAVINNKLPGTEYENSIISLFDKTFAEDTSSSKLICEIAEYQAATKRSSVGVYRIAGIDASMSNTVLQYFDIPVSLTKTETMILRFLIASYPLAKSSREILKYSFRSGKTPDPASIRTHVSSINSKFLKATQKRIISNEHSIGYSVITHNF